MILHRSLAVYLADAVPWVAFGETSAREALDRLIADNRQYVTRLSDLLLARRYAADWGEFPMEFTALHDVGLNYLVKQLIHYQRRDISQIERCAAELAGDAEGQALAQEILSTARRHLENFESLQKRPSPAAKA